MKELRRTVALRALPLIDLTDLGEATTDEATDRLCARAVRPLPAYPHLHVAAVCVWPRFVRRARANLDGGPVRIATVANFPSGAEAPASVAETIDRALGDGADEIDLVLDYRAFLAGNTRAAAERVETVRNGLPRGIRLKVILETGELGGPDTIRAAAHLAATAGADFLKTSTGKVKVNATLESARILMEIARDAGRPIGVKPSGGIRTTDDAAAYLALADEVFGPGWATPTTFRFGASGLLDDLLAAITGTDGAPVKAGY